MRSRCATILTILASHRCAPAVDKAASSSEARTRRSRPSSTVGSPRSESPVAACAAAMMSPTFIQWHSWLFVDCPRPAASGTQVSVQLLMHVQDDLLLIGSEPRLAHGPRVQALLHARDVAQVLAWNEQHLLGIAGIGHLLDD